MAHCWKGNGGWGRRGQLSLFSKASGRNGSGVVLGGSSACHGEPVRAGRGLRAQVSPEGGVTGGGGRQPPPALCATLAKLVAAKGGIPTFKPNPEIHLSGLYASSYIPIDIIIFFFIFT